MSSNKINFKGITRARLILWMLFFIFLIAAAWWYYIQGEAMLLLSQAKWSWTESEANFQIDSDFSLNISDLDIKNKQYNNLLSWQDFSITGENNYYNINNNFTARGDFDVSSDSQGSFEAVIHYKKIDNDLYIRPEMSGDIDFLSSSTLNSFFNGGSILGIKMAAAGDPYTTVSFSYSDALHDPDHNNGMTEDEIFAMYDYIIAGEYTWHNIQNDVNKEKSLAAINKLKKINPDISIKSFKKKINSKNIDRIGKAFHIIVDGSDNFKTRFLINDYCFKKKKVLISGAISKFDGQVYTFNFLKKNSPCLRCFIPKMPPNPDIDNCEFDGVLGPLAGIIGSIQANEVAKEILGIGNTLCGFILIVDALKLTFRKVKLNKRSGCTCYEKKK